MWAIPPLTILFISKAPNSRHEWDQNMQHIICEAFLHCYYARQTSIENVSVNKEEFTYTKKLHGQECAYNYKGSWEAHELQGKIRTCLSSNIADPSSNISSTEPKEADLLSFPTELWDLLPKIRDLNLFWFFFGDNAGGVEQWSDGMMSTTTHVVSSFNPLVFRACWTSKMDTN